jgi:hypothetical protein
MALLTSCSTTSAKKDIHQMANASCECANKPTDKELEECYTNWGHTYTSQGYNEDEQRELLQLISACEIK